MLVARAMLVFDRIRRAIGEVFDNIGLADQPQTVTKQRQGALNPQTITNFKAGIINTLVQGLTALGVDIFREPLLQMNQTALARTVAPVLEGGERKRVGSGIHGVCARIHFVIPATSLFRRIAMPLTPFENIKTMALQLPMADRTRLVETLLASLSEEDEILAEWVEEAERRWDAYERGEMVAVDFDESMARARAKLTHCYTA